MTASILTPICRHRMKCCVQKLSIFMKLPPDVILQDINRTYMHTLPWCFISTKQKSRKIFVQMISKGASLSLRNSSFKVNGHQMPNLISRTSRPLPSAELVLNPLMKPQLDKWLFSQALKQAKWTTKTVPRIFNKVLLRKGQSSTVDFSIFFFKSLITMSFLI